MSWSSILFVKGNLLDAIGDGGRRHNENDGAGRKRRFDLLPVLEKHKAGALEF